MFVLLSCFDSIKARLSMPSSFLFPCSVTFNFPPSTYFPISSNWLFFLQHFLRFYIFFFFFFLLLLLLLLLVAFVFVLLPAFRGLQHPIIAPSRQVIYAWELLAVLCFLVVFISLMKRVTVRVRQTLFTTLLVRAGLEITSLVDTKHSRH